MKTYTLKKCLCTVLVIFLISLIPQRMYAEGSIPKDFGFMKNMSLGDKDSLMHQPIPLVSIVNPIFGTWGTNDVILWVDTFYPTNVDIISYQIDGIPPSDCSNFLPHNLPIIQSFGNGYTYGRATLWWLLLGQHTIYVCGHGYDGVGYVNSNVESTTYKVVSLVKVWDLMKGIH